MTHNGDALSRFRGILLQDVTSQQLDAVLGPTSLTPATADQLEQANLIAQAVAAQRCYPFGLPLPDASEVSSQEIDPIATGIIQPPGTEIWDILNVRAMGIGGQATATISWTDGVIDSDINVGAAIPVAGANVDLNGSVSGPRRLTHTCYLKIAETGGVFGIGLFVAYHVVSK